MPSKFRKAIGAVKDTTSIGLAKVVATNNSSNLEVIVLKATTHNAVPMEERYVVEILRLVSADKANAAACARALGKRIGRTRNWIVAVKSLMLVLRIFQDGDPYFPREVLHAMKRGAKILNLSSFRDDSNSSPWDYTAFVRRFAFYLDERLDCFLTGKLQRRYTHQQLKEPLYLRTRRANESVREMKPSVLLDKISYWQRLLNRAVATRPTGAAKTNRLVHSALHAVVQETFDLYKDISDGLALLLDRFFHLEYNSCVNAFQACVKAAKQFEELSEFYNLCKGVGVGRTSEYPSVQKISQELIETLQEFLKDQSSFPTMNRSEVNPQLILQEPPSAGGSHRHYDDSCAQSEFSQMSHITDRSSDCSSQNISIEDLISATELSGANPSISIDLEAYSISEQLANHSQNDMWNEDTGSARSLPVTNSIIDLLSFDEWPQPEQQVVDQVQEGGEPEREQEKSEPSSGECWALVLAGSTATPIQPSTSNIDPSSGQEQEHKPLEPISAQGWDLVLAGTVAPPSAHSMATTTDFEASPVDKLLYQTSLTPPQDQYCNPFLQDPPELTCVGAGAQPSFPADGGFWSEPTFPAIPTFSTENPDALALALPGEYFQAAPTFSTQNPDALSLALPGGNDPFSLGPFEDGSQQGFDMPPTNEQNNLIYEQQLWLQRQNKIMARHTN
ncbi:hypothetical protein NMG60_11003154 [Bertholletia excelsa]